MYTLFIIIYTYIYIFEWFKATISLSSPGSIPRSRLKTEDTSSICLEQNPAETAAVYLI